MLPCRVCFPEHGLEAEIAEKDRAAILATMHQPNPLDVEARPVITFRSTLCWYLEQR
jgi:hypothetical protein